MHTQINRRNFRQEYNLLRVECEELRINNLRLKTEMIKLLDMFKKRPKLNTFEKHV